MKDQKLPAFFCHKQGISIRFRKNLQQGYNFYINNNNKTVQTSIPLNILSYKRDMHSSIH